MTRTDNDNQLDVLLRELAELRDDDRYHLSQFPVLIAAALTLIGAMAALFATTCPEGYPSPDSRLFAVPIWVYITAPMLPIVIIGYVILIATLGTLRSYYQRAVERKIQYLTLQNENRLPIPSWAHAQLEVWGQAHAGRLSLLSWLLVYGIIALMVLGGCVALASKIPVIRYRVFALVINGALMVIPISGGVFGVTGGARLWNDALAGLRERLLKTDRNFRPLEKRDKRSLTQYLLLPRNQEELLKALFIPISLVIGRILVPGIPHWTWGVQDWDGSRSSFWHIFIFFFVFEFLIYQARYLFNDVRDRHTDCGRKFSKERFPMEWLDGGKKEELALMSAFGSFLARLVTAGLLVGCILPYKDSMWVWHVGFLLTVFLVAWPYEIARDRCNIAARPESRTAWTIVLTVVVGLGYSLRSVVGFWLAGVDDKFALLLVAAGAWLFGITFVALGWALESTRAAREVLQAGKAHLVLSYDIVSQTAKRTGVPVSTSEKVLALRQPLIAPWSVGGVLSTGVLLTFVLYILRDHFNFGHVNQLRLIVVTVVCISGVAVVIPVKTAFHLVGLSFVGLAVLLQYLSASTVQGDTAALVVFLPLIIMCIFRNMRFDDLPGFMNNVGKIVSDGWELLFSWFKKERKSEALAPSSALPPPGES